MIGNHYVLVATPRAYREPTCIIGVQFADVLHMYVEFVGRFLYGWRRVVVGRRRRPVNLLTACVRVCRPYTLSCLDHVSLECFIGVRAVFCCVLVSEPRPRRIVACFNGAQPCVAYREAGCSVEVPYQGLHAGEIVCTVRP